MEYTETRVEWRETWRQAYMRKITFIKKDFQLREPFVEIFFRNGEYHFLKDILDQLLFIFLIDTIHCLD